MSAHATAIVTALGLVAGYAVVDSLRSAVSGGALGGRGHRSERSLGWVLLLCSLTWGCLVLLWCGFSIWGAQGARLPGGLVAGGVLLGACAVFALRRRVVGSLRRALARQSLAAMACAVGWGIFLPADSESAAHVRRVALAAACYIIAAVGVWFLLLARDTRSAVHAIHLAEMLASATLVLIPFMTLPMIQALSVGEASYRLTQAGILSTVALSLLHLWPAARRRAANRRGTMARSLIAPLVGGAGLFVGAVAFAVLLLRTSVPFVFLLAPIGLGYFPYLLLCIGDAIVGKAEGRSSARTTTG